MAKRSACPWEEPGLDERGLFINPSANEKGLIPQAALLLNSLTFNVTSPVLVAQSFKRERLGAPGILYQFANT